MNFDDQPAVSHGDDGPGAEWVAWLCGLDRMRLELYCDHLGGQVPPDDTHIIMWEVACDESAKRGSWDEWMKQLPTEDLEQYVAGFGVDGKGGTSHLIGKIKTRHDRAVHELAQRTD